MLFCDTSCLHWDRTKWAGGLRLQQMRLQVHRGSSGRTQKAQQFNPDHAAGSPRAWGAWLLPVNTVFRDSVGQTFVQNWKHGVEIPLKSCIKTAPSIFYVHGGQRGFLGVLETTDWHYLITVTPCPPVQAGTPKFLEILYCARTGVLMPKMHSEHKY